MKPVKLVIEGVNSFIEPQTLDFEAAGRNNLFCISGKTGAGKTTIFDSIMLALYGRSSKGNLADVVNLSRMSARVVLDFTAGGDMYSVDRTIKCRYEKTDKGEPTDKRLAVSDCTLYKNGAPFAKGEEATAVIADIIGLEANEFKNVYLLEQGEYAEFLKKPPQRQLEAVGKIFSLMRFGDVYKLAGERARATETEAESVQRVMSTLGDATPEALAAETKTLAALKTKTTMLGKDAEQKRGDINALEKARDEFLTAREKQNAVRTLMLQLDEAGKTKYTAEQNLAEFEKTVDNKAAQELAELRERLNELSKLNAVDREFSVAMRDIEQKTVVFEQKLKDAEHAADEYNALEISKRNDVNAFGSKLGEFISLSDGGEKSDTLIAAINTLSSPDATTDDVADAAYSLKTEYNKAVELVAARKECELKLEKSDADAKRQLDKITAYNNDISALDAEKAAAETAEKDAQAALTKAQVCSHAAAVRAELNAGDRCPVCGGVYDGNAVSDGGDVDACKAAHEKAAAELKEIIQKQTERTKLLDRAKAEYEHISNEINDEKKTLGGIDEQLDRLRVDIQKYPKMLEILNETKILGEKCKISAKKCDEQLPKIAALKVEKEAAEQAISDAKNKADKHRNELGELCGKTDEKITEIKNIIDEKARKIEQTESTRKKLAGEVAAAVATVGAVSASLDAAKAVCPVDMPSFDEEGYAAKREELERLTKHIAENEKDIAVKELEVKTLGEQCAALAEHTKNYKQLITRATLYKKIAEMTKGKAMLNFVAAEYIDEFTAAASDILNELSGGKYTMLYDKSSGFIVSDYLNGGKSRKTDTLSGGELFLASLSVAIAIARTQAGGNNAFFFLDEGFGTLDDDLIDTVYGALESLSKDCLVGVISHSNSLIDKMPSCVEVLEATDSAGSIIKN